MKRNFDAISASDTSPWPHHLFIDERDPILDDDSTIRLDSSCTPQLSTSSDPSSFTTSPDIAQDFLDNIDVHALLIYDSASGIIEYANLTTLHLLQLHADDLIGKHIETIDNYTLDKAEEEERLCFLSSGGNWKKCVETSNTIVLITESYFLHGNVTKVLRSISKNNFLAEQILKLRMMEENADKKFQGYIDQIREENEKLQEEILHRRRAESELSLVSMVAQKTDNSVIITDDKKRCIWVNKSFTRYTGFSLEDMYGKSPGEVLQCEKTDPKAIAKLSKMLRENKPVSLIITNRTKDNSLIHVNLDISPVFDESGTLRHFIAFQRTIKQNELDELRTTAVERAKDQSLANRMKTEFIIDMSHQLRTPLNGILGTTSAMLHGPLDDIEDVNEGLRTILVSSKALLVMINNVIDLSRIENDRMGVSNETINLSRAIKNVVNSCKAIAAEKRIEIKSYNDQRLASQINCDAVKLSRVLENLLYNAVKFTKEDGKITIYIKKVDDPTGLSKKASFEKPKFEGPGMFLLKISVSDQGPGIEKSTLEKVFQRFSAPSSGDLKTKYGGSGIGLHVSQEMLRLVSGRLWVEKTEKGIGTTFSFVMPVGAGSRPNSPVFKNVLVSSKIESPIPKWNVLVAEDNKINQKVISSLLSKFKMHPDIVNNGKEAVELIQSGKRFDLVMLDIHMPVMGGMEAARQINKLVASFTRPKIVALTADTEKETISECIRAGMDFFLAKPLTFGKLRDFILSITTDQLSSPTPLPPSSPRETI